MYFQIDNMPLTCIVLMYNNATWWNNNIPFIFEHLFMISRYGTCTLFEEPVHHFKYV